MNDGSGEFIPVETVGLGTVHAVRGGYGALVDGGPHADTAWQGSRGKKTLVNHSPQWGATYLQDGILDRRETVELPRRGVSRTGGDEDSNAGSFLPPVFPGYCHNFGGGKYPPPMVPPMRHAGALTYNEQGEPCHRPL